MRIDAAESRLFHLLSSPRDSSSIHARGLTTEEPNKLEMLSVLGLDTNILKILRRDTSFAEKLFVLLPGADVRLIVPAQSVLEFWNNHSVFAGEEWAGFSTELGKLRRRVGAGREAGHVGQLVDEIERLVEELAADLQESTSPEYLERSRSLITSMLDLASKPMVSRARFAEIANTRLLSRMPPGFADSKTKAAGLGDFFVWCDFLLGVIASDLRERSGRQAFKAAWVTDDAKPDWKSGTRAHPQLVEEFDFVSGGELHVLSSAQLRSLVDRAEESLRMTAPDERDT